MTPSRFAALAAAYGGAVDRWPPSEQADARAHLLRVADAADILRAEAELDRTLAMWTVPGAGAALAASIAGAALQRRSRMRRLRLWLSGVGAAATLTGGVAAGMTLVARPTSAPEYGATSLYEMQVLGEPLDVSLLPAGPER